MRTSMMLVRSALIALGACCLRVSDTSARPLEEIITSRSFSICAGQDELPYSADSSATPGLYVEIARQIAVALGVDLKVEWIRSREQIRLTTCDAVMGVAAPAEPYSVASLDRKAVLARILTIPYMTVSPLLVLSGRKREVRSIDDLKHLHVAVPSGSVAHKFLNDSGVPVWVRFRNDAEIIEAVRSGQADAGVVSPAGFGWYRKNQPETALIGIDRVLTDPELQFKVAIGLRNTNVETVTRVNEILRQLIGDGSLRQIFRKYGIDLVN